MTANDAVSPAERIRDQRAGGGWIWWTAGIGVAAAVALLLIWASQGRDPSEPDGREIAAPPAYESMPEDPVPRDNTPPEREDDAPEPNNTEPPPTAVRNDKPDSDPTTDNPPSEPDSPTTDESTSPVPDDNDPPPRPLRRRPPSYPAIAFNWADVEGLVVAKVDESSEWSGARAESLESKANHYATLPGSWAKAETTRFGEIVFDANTHLAVLPNPDGSAPELNVRHGRVAFRDTPADSEFEFRTGVQHFSLQAPKSSSFAVVYGPGGPQVWVRRGKLQLGDSSIRKGQFVHWENGGFSDAKKLKEGTAWFDDAPLDRVRLDKPSQQRLLESDNVFADLARISQNGSADLQAAAASWNVMLNPIGHLHRGLTTPNPLVRMRTLRWLNAQDPRDRLTGLVWRKLGQDTGDFQTITQIRQWNKRLWLKQPADPQLAGQMVRGLSNNDQAIRQLSIFYLEANFGRRFTFDPAARTPSQRQAISGWSQFVRAYFTTR